MFKTYFCLTVSRNFEEKKNFDIQYDIFRVVIRDTSIRTPRYGPNRGTETLGIVLKAPDFFFLLKCSCNRKDS